MRILFLAVLLFTTLLPKSATANEPNYDCTVFVGQSSAAGNLEYNKQINGIAINSSSVITKLSDTYSVRVGLKDAVSGQRHIFVLDLYMGILLSSSRPTYTSATIVDSLPNYVFVGGWDNSAYLAYNMNCFKN